MSEEIKKEDSVLVPIDIENVSLRIMVRINGNENRQRYDEQLRIINELKAKFGPDTLLDALSTCLIGTDIESVQIRGGNRSGGAEVRRGDAVPAQGALRSAPGWNAPGGYQNPGSFSPNGSPMRHEHEPQFAGGNFSTGPTGHVSSGAGGSLAAGGQIPTGSAGANGGTQVRGFSEPTHRTFGAKVLTSTRFAPGTTIQILDPQHLDQIMRHDPMSLSREDYNNIAIYLTNLNNKPELPPQIPLSKDVISW